MTLDEVGGDGTIGSGDQRKLEVPGLRLMDDLERRPGNIPKPLLAVIGEAIDIMREEQLLAPTAIWKVWPVCSVDCSGVALDEGTHLPLLDADKLMTGARGLVFGICSIGTAAEARISELFRSKQYRLSLVIDGLANRALFRLSEYVLRRLRGEAGSLGLRLGQSFAPGNTGLSLKCQDDVVRLAGGVEAGFSVTETGMVRPGRTLDFVAGMGAELPKWRARLRCQNCPSGSHCFNRITRDYVTFQDRESSRAAK